MSKRESNILKCAAIILMLFHHLFMYADQADFPQLIYGPLLSSPERLAAVGQLSKLCVTIFVFVSAYGTARAWKTDPLSDTRAVIGKCVDRLVKLLVSFWCVYIIAFALCPLGGKNWLTLYSPSRLENLFFALMDFLGISFVIGTPSYNSSWWYMSLALLLIIIMPLLIKACRRYGAFILLAELILVRWLNVYFVIYRYLFICLIGVLMAEHNVFESFMGLYRRIKLPFKALVWLVLLAFLAVFSVLWLRAGEGLLDIYEAILCLCVMLLMMLSVARIPGINRVAAYVGSHSMNMFFFHAFIYQNWFYDFTYSLKYPIVIFLFLFISTLLFSVVLEEVKKLIKLDKLTSFLSGKAQKLLLPKA